MLWLALEAIIHPYVRKAVDYMIKNAKQDVVVVEAIKLLESPLKDRCDVIWVTTSSEDNQTGAFGLQAGYVCCRIPPADGSPVTAVLERLPRLIW